MRTMIQKKHERRKAKAERTGKTDGREQFETASGAPLGSGRIYYRGQAPRRKGRGNAQNRRNLAHMQAERVGESDDVMSQSDVCAEPEYGERSNTVFSGKLRGQQVVLKDVPMKVIRYNKRSTDKLIELRSAFNTTERKKFLQSLAKERECLIEAGLSEKDILRMTRGIVPKGWQVHHKLPLDDSGTNEFENLILIKNEPYHKLITIYQNRMTRNIQSGSMIVMKWPIPVGSIYPERGNENVER